MLPLIKEKMKSHQDAKVWYFCEKRMLQKLAKSKNYQKVRDYCHYTGKYRDTAHSICDLKINVPNKIPVLFHNGSNYVYLFIIKKFINFFYSNLNMEDITNAVYTHLKRVCKDFAIKNLDGYHDLYLKSDTLLLADVFKNFKKCA